MSVATITPLASARGALFNWPVVVGASERKGRSYCRIHTSGLPVPEVSRITVDLLILISRIMTCITDVDGVSLISDWNLYHHIVNISLS